MPFGPIIQTLFHAACLCRFRLLLPVAMLAVVVPAPAQQRPCNACVFVGQRHCRDVSVAPPADANHPAAARVALSGRHPQGRARPVDEQRSQVGIAPFADAQQPLLATAAHLARRQPKEAFGSINDCLAYPVINDGDYARRVFKQSIFGRICIFCRIQGKASVGI